MNKKYIIGGVIIVIFIAIALTTFDYKKIDYTDFSTAAASEKTVQISGSWVKEDNYTYHSEKNIFTFNMKDDNNNITKVVYSGAKPNNFDLAPRIVIKGKYKGKVFEATDILTKCPSKYQGNGEKMI